MNQYINEEAIEDIATRMDLRKPNREALETMALALSHYYSPTISGVPPYEAVIVSATGVGKTYILASAMEYLASVDGVRNFTVIAPGRTIMEKTISNFTPGHPKSLLGAMNIRPVVVTSENFDSAATRAAMDDPEQVKLYVFTVQSLIKPNTKLGRRTHEFREGLGEAFYGHLQGLDDLIIFADEHHCYYSPAFSDTIRNLVPKALIGLTATPHSSTPDGQVIYRYPLAAAVADQLVKTPVIVGRRDQRDDALTQLTDGARLLELKQRSIRNWCAAQGIESINPVMLVVAQTIEDAQMYDEILRSTSFMDGRYADAVLTVHSKSPDEALELLDNVEDPNSPIRIIISVGMLKEGWDVKNVYVLASMRASISDILTEQTMGRGLRLPFGSYTGVELLDTLEVLAHERYDDLLRRAQIMNEQMVDYRVRLVAVQDETGANRGVRLERKETSNPGETQPKQEQEQKKEQEQNTDAGKPGNESEEDQQHTTDGHDEGLSLFSTGTTSNGFSVKSFENHITSAENEAAQVREMLPREGFAKLDIPTIQMQRVDSPFSLADITNMESFRQLGRKFRQAPDDMLRRQRLQARIVTDNSGLRRTEIYAEQAKDTIYSQAVLIPFDLMVEDLLSAVIHSEIVPERASELLAARKIVDALVEGMGTDAHVTLSSYFDTIRARLVEAVLDSASRFARPPQILDVLEVKPFGPTRMTRPNPSLDRRGQFHARQPYIGWKKSMYEQAWFDSEPERTMANLLDETDEIQYWVRLHLKDLPILWNSQDNWYNPDFIAQDTDGVRWIIEVKSDKEMSSSDVQAKKDAAARWANHASLDAQVNCQWRYLLVAERVLREAHGAWRMVKTLAEGN